MEMLDLMDSQVDSSPKIEIAAWLDWRVGLVHCWLIRFHRS